MPRTDRNRAPGEGTLYEEKSRNRWVGAVVIDGKRRKVTAKTKTEARQKLNALTRSRDNGEQVGDGNTTVAQLVDKWMARDVASRSIAPSTLDTYRWSTRNINAGLGKRRVRELTTDDIENWLDKMSEAGLARSSLKKFRSTLRQALEFGERRGVVNRNAASIAKLTPGARPTAERTALTPDQLRTFLTVCANERLGAMFAIQATVGLRPGEASGLCWDAVDLESGTITIRTAVRNEGNTAVLVDRLKTRRAHRAVVLPVQVIRMLTEHRRRQTIERLASDSWADSRLVFATRAGTPLSASNVRRELDRITLEAELPGVTPNELRHTAASNLSAAGVPIEQIADVLGHTDTAMLMEVYRHAVRPSIDAAASAMNRLIAENA
jgi:integrase